MGRVGRRLVRRRTPKRSSPVLAIATLLGFLSGCGRFGYDLEGIGVDDANANDGSPPDGGPSDGMGRLIDGKSSGVVFPDGEVRVSRAPGRSLHPALAWTGKELLVVWDDQRSGNQDIYLASLPANGEPVAVRLTDDSAQSGFPNAAWASEHNHLAVAWEDNRDGNAEIYFGRFGRDGSPFGELRATNTPAESYDPSIVWNGSEHGIAYHEGSPSQTSIRLQRVGSDGASIGKASTLSRGSGLAQFASLTWTGQDYGVAWQDNRDGPLEVYFGRVDPNGGPVNKEVEVSTSGGGVWFLSLTWSGSEYGVAWADARNGGQLAIFFSRLGTDGTKLADDDVQLSKGGGDAKDPSVAWIGNGYAVAWDQGGEIRYAVLDTSGKIVKAVQPVSTGKGASEPTVAWLGDRIAVAWHDTRHGEEEIYVRVLAP